MTNPTPDQIKLARKIAASLRPYSHNSALILDGERDGIDIVRVALAAIIETTERAARLGANRGWASHKYAAALRAGEHLK